MNKHLKHYQTIRDGFVLRDGNTEKQDDIYDDDDEETFDTEMDNDTE